MATAKSKRTQKELREYVRTLVSDEAEIDRIIISEIGTSDGVNKEVRVELIITKGKDLVSKLFTEGETDGN